jgi:hypothetical protein
LVCFVQFVTKLSLITLRFRAASALWWTCRFSLAFEQYNWHGIAILTLSALRLLWRLSHRHWTNPHIPTDRCIRQSRPAVLFSQRNEADFSSAAGHVVWGLLPLPPDLVGRAQPGLTETLRLTAC